MLFAMQCVSYGIFIGSEIALGIIEKKAKSHLKGHTESIIMCLYSAKTRDGERRESVHRRRTTRIEFAVHVLAWMCERQKLYTIPSESIKKRLFVKNERLWDYIHVIS